jgi:hypothetical protein
MPFCFIRRFNASVPKTGTLRHPRGLWCFHEPPNNGPIRWRWRRAIYCTQLVIRVMNVLLILVSCSSISFGSGFTVLSATPTLWPQMVRWMNDELERSRRGLMGVLLGVCLVGTEWYHEKHHYHFFWSMAQQPLVGQGLLIIEASRSHSDTPHSVGLLWASRLLPLHQRIVFSFVSVYLCRMSLLIGLQDNFYVIFYGTVFAFCPKQINVWRSEYPMQTVQFQPITVCTVNISRPRSVVFLSW